MSANSSNRSEEDTSELQSPCNLVCRLQLEKNTPNARDGGSGDRARPLPRQRGLTRARRPSTRAIGWVPPVRSTRDGAADVCFFFSNDPATPGIPTLALPAALPL